jgi:hypothetical protein
LYKDVLLIIIYSVHNKKSKGKCAVPPYAGYGEDGGYDQQK